MIELLTSNNRFSLTPNPACRRDPLFTLLTLQSAITPPPVLLLRLCGGGSGRFAGEISRSGIPVWVFLGVTWVAEE